MSAYLRMCDVSWVIWNSNIIWNPNWFRIMDLTYLCKQWWLVYDHFFYFSFLCWMNFHNLNVIWFDLYWWHFLTKSLFKRHSLSYVVSTDRTTPGPWVRPWFLCNEDIIFKKNHEIKKPQIYANPFFYRFYGVIFW